ncbi:MAG: uridine diphosphate-N-acetylglucosamine-binding protein YvcK [Actinomycetota bacterium]|nr:uridine diphosphate-N-acetylglucosamine-binding protein YvcK [Actinomycetota bacterium]
MRDGGPRVVALGGGHGTAVTLSAARHYAGDLTAIVSVADDGGSSGRLRQSLGIPAPGDLRRCLVALSDPDTNALAQAFEHRFEDGHALGNLIIAGLTASTGSFIKALDEAARLLEADGRVLPATKDAVILKAVADTGEIEGQVNVASAGRIAHVGIVPADACPPQEALDAIAAADQLVLGPGSLFTSVLAVVAVTHLRRALRRADAPVVYVCNLRTSDETPGFDVAAHVDALVAHGLTPDVVLADPAAIEVGSVADGVRVVLANLTDRATAAHDPVRLARLLADLVG